MVFATQLLWKALALGSLVSEVAARLPDGRLHGNMLPFAAAPRVSTGVPAGTPVVSRNGTVLPPYDTVYYFDQLIDHTNPSLGTFKQRYWHTMEWYEPGGPVILNTPGEVNAQGYTGYLTNRTMNGMIAQQQNGTTIVLEHRFYGLSNPYPDLSAESFRVHTIQQAIEDLAYFANNVKLPMPDGDKIGPKAAPWVLMGGSYSGALTSWAMVNKPGLFWAGYGSSGVVEAILEFWRYFEPVRQNMPKNCSADVSAVIAHVDKVFKGHDQAAIQNLKNNWGLGSMTHLDDVAGALRNNLWDWQSLSLTTGPAAQFWQFCDALEVKDGVSASAKGWGLDHALNAWGSYWNSTYYARLCGTADPETCLGTYDPNSTFYTDTSIDNNGRSWFWIVCNEVGYLQGGPPPGFPAIVTSLVPAPYDLRQCQLMFPSAFPKPPTPRTQHTNTAYKGWDVRLNRLFFANGRRDPWKDATVSAEQHFVPSTPQQPIGLGDGFHCSDLTAAQGVANPTIKQVQTDALKYMAKWLSEWSLSHHHKRQVDGGDLVQPDVKPVNAWFRQPVEED